MLTSSQANKSIRTLKGIIGGSNSTTSLVIAYIIICIAFTITSPYFLTLKNIFNVATYASITGVMGAGVTVAMLIGSIDLSQYSICTLAGITAAFLLKGDTPIGWVILAALLVGLIGGIVNGLLVAYLKISGIIATMGTMQVFRGLAYILTNGETILIESKTFDIIGKGYLLNTIPVAVIIMFFVFILTFYILKYTSFGRKVFSVGGNENASYLAGVNIGAIKLGTMVVSSICASIAGLILASQVGAAVPSTGVGMEMGVLSAVILGGVSLSGGKGRISGTVIGIFILATIQNGMTLLSIRSFYQMLINGGVLIAAVTLDVIRSGALKKK
jgi:ribose/xylose/arabinose/galactoside ABC-type transport system permease subunit